METDIENPQKLYDELASDYFNCQKFENELRKSCSWIFKDSYNKAHRNQISPFMEHGYIKFKMYLPKDSQFLFCQKNENSDKVDVYIKDLYKEYLKSSGWNIKTSIGTLKNDKYPIKVTLSPIEKIKTLKEFSNK